MERIENYKIGGRLDSEITKYLKKGDSTVTRSQISGFISDGVKVNGKTVKTSYRTKEGDLIEIDMEYFKKYMSDLSEKNNLLQNITPQVSDLDIVEENSDYIVLKKPKGLVVHPGVGNESDTLANYIRGYLEAKGEFDESVERGGIVHRLDKGVSGLMVVAKSRESQLLLKDEFENHRVMKVYVAQIEVLQNLPIQREVPDGSVKGDSWYRAEGTVARDPSDRQKMRFRFGDLSSGKKAISNICRLDDDHLAIKIETGRMHQIRATLREMGWGIIGDEKYGKGTGDSIHLESVLLGFNFKGKYREYLL